MPDELDAETTKAAQAVRAQRLRAAIAARIDSKRTAPQTPRELTDEAAAEAARCAREAKQSQSAKASED